MEAIKNNEILLVQAGVGIGKSFGYLLPISYTYKNGETHTGYVTALYPELNALNFQSPTKHCKKVNAKKCRLLWRFHKIYWLDNVI